MLTVCSTCGTPYDKEEGHGSCPECRPARTESPTRGTRTARGYDNAWVRLSRQARRLQPFCLDCGSPYDLTADHSPEAWRRKAEGKAIRLTDIDVVCRPCNSARGAARGESSNRWGGQGMPAPDELEQRRAGKRRAEADELEHDEADELAAGEGCDGLCEGLCPEHRDPRG